MTALVVAASALSIAALGAATLWLVVRPPRLRSTGDRRLHRLADGVFQYRGHFSNAAVFVLPEGVVLVDTLVSPHAARRMRARIEAVTDLPIRYVVNTHYHGDHLGGNAVFAEAEIIGTEATARFAVERADERTDYARTFGLEFGEVPVVVPPTRTFEGRLELEIGGEVVEVLQLGPNETPDACAVHWPSRRAVACGDGVSTWDYPFLGDPLIDEGLRDDGGWIGFLRQVRALRPQILIGGHGPALVGEQRVAARLDLLIALMTDLLDATRRELAAGTEVPVLVDRVDRELRRYPKQAGLREVVTGQRFAVYRCVNNMLPDRAGRGWWHDLRPSVVRRAGAEAVEAELGQLDGSSAVIARAEILSRRGDRPLALGLLEAWTAREPNDADALGLMADLLFDCAVGIKPAVDGTEYVALANQAAKRALAIDPAQPLARLHLGVAEVFGAMVLAQPMGPGVEKIKAALATPLTARQRRKAAFFLGKASQYEDRPDESDRWFREVLPRWARPAFPLVRERMRCTP